MEIWLAEHRMRAGRLATARLTSATWVLVLVTVVLASATRTKPPRRGCSLRRWGASPVSLVAGSARHPLGWRADDVS